MSESFKDYVDRRIEESNRCMNEFKERGELSQAAHCEGAKEAYLEIKEWITHENAID